MVEVVKTCGKKPPVLDCHCPEDEARQEEVIVSIREVSFQSVESERKDLNYTVNTDPLDWASYDHLMDFPADGWVGNTSADELVEFRRDLEH